jgi:nucleoside-diphosphate-sugar epimerase
MKIVVIGANGTIGSAIVQALGQDHQLVKVGKTRGDVQLDIADPYSVHTAFGQIGPCGLPAGLRFPGGVARFE